MNMRFKIYSGIVANICAMFTLRRYVAPITCRGLVLSGGGSYGAFQNGVLSRLSAGGDWDYVSGVSSGAINALYIATTPPGTPVRNETENMRKLWVDMSSEDVYKKVYYTNGISLYDSSPLKGTLQRLFEGRRLQREVIVGATSLTNKVGVKWDASDLAGRITDSLMASTALPFLFQPYFFRDNYFVDGAVSSNILALEVLEKCRKRSTDRIEIDIVLDDNPYPVRNATATKTDVKTIEDLIRPLLSTVAFAGEYNQLLTLLDMRRPCSVSKTKVNLFQATGIGVDYLDFDHGEEMWEAGWEKAGSSDYSFCVS